MPEAGRPFLPPDQPDSSPVIRADGYHILADATGVPDLYAHLVPTMKQLLPGQRRQPSALSGRARFLRQDRLKRCPYKMRYTKPAESHSKVLHEAIEPPLRPLSNQSMRCCDVP